MYEAFYGFREKPFSLLPDPDYLYLSEQHQMAMTLLEYSLENQAGFCVISGNIGTGKTTLIRYLLNRIGNDISVGLISNTHQSFGELLRWILHAFNLESAGKSKAEMHQVFSDYLIAQYARNRRTMIIVDEAQNMSPAALEELRMLSNINSEKDLVLQLMLVGQPGLRELLQRPELEQLTQRVAVDYHLKPLNAAETRGYIRHRIAVVGGDPELFTDAACDAVFRYSGGTPRLINLLCDLVLVYAYAEQVTMIDRDLVDQVVRERQAHGVLPIFVAGALPPERPREAVTAAKIAPAPRPSSNAAPAPVAPRVESPVDTIPVAAHTAKVAVADEVTPALNVAASTRPGAASRPHTVDEIPAIAATAPAVAPPLSGTGPQVVSAPAADKSASVATTRPGAMESVSDKSDVASSVAAASAPVRVTRRWWVAGIAAGVVSIGTAAAWWFFTETSPPASQTAAVAPAPVAPPSPADSASPNPPAAPGGATPQAGPVPGVDTTVATPNTYVQPPATVAKPEPAPSTAISKPKEHAKRAAPVVTRHTPARETVVSPRETAAPKVAAPAKVEPPTPAPVAEAGNKDVIVEKVAAPAAPATKTIAEAASVPAIAAPAAVPVVNTPQVIAPRAEASRPAAPVKAAAESGAEFAADPCKGVAARFLSTCQ